MVSKDAIEKSNFKKHNYNGQKLLNKLLIYMLTVAIVFACVPLGLIGTNTVMAALPGMHHAASGGDVFLGGNYIELGLSKSGSFGSASAAPTGFHPYGRSNLGMCVNGAGFDTGTPAKNGDFFLPGCPAEGFIVGYRRADGGPATQYKNEERDAITQIPTTSTDTTRDGSGTLSALNTGTTADGKIKIDTVTTLGVNDKYFKTTVTYKNVSSANLYDVRYMRYVDPDQDADMHWDFSTRNAVTSNCPGDTYSMVSATGLESGTTMFYFSSDSRSRASGRFPFTMTNVYDPGSYNIDGSKLKFSNDVSDTGIGMTFGLGELDAGKSTTFTYYTSLDPNFKESLDNILDASAAFKINAGAAATSTPSVTLSLQCDSATKMMISNDVNFTGASWEPYSTTKAWTLTSGDGDKTVYAKFQDTTGLTSAPASQKITLDASPVWASSYPNVGAVTNGTRQVLVKDDKNGNVYYVCLLKGATVPTAAQVKSGKNAGNTDATIKGSIPMTANTEAGINISSLADPKFYDIYVVAENSHSLTQDTPTKVSADEQESVMYEKANLQIGYNGSDNASNVTQNITLPATGANGTTISWASTDTATIADGTSGSVSGTVNQPAWYSSDKSVTLTATISKGLSNDTKVFNLIVRTAPKLATLLPSSISPVYNAGTPVSVDPGLTLDSTSYMNGARLYIADGFDKVNDTLNFSDQNNITGSYDSDKGILTLTGSDTAANYQAALRSVTFSNSNDSIATGTTRRIVVSMGNDTLYCAATGHYYKYVASSGISWNDAKAAAEKSSYFGLKGYLALIGSNAENDFITSKFAGSGWIGASDAYDSTHYYGPDPSRSTADAYIVEYGGGSSGDTSKFQLSFTKNLSVQNDYNDLVTDESNLKIGYTDPDKATDTGSGNSSVTQNVILPTTLTPNGSKVTWSSDNSSVIAVSGTVNRPGYDKSDVTVNLNAAISKGSYSDIKSFSLTVKKSLPSSNSKLASLNIPGLNINPGFSPTTTDYSTADVPNGTDKITLSAIPQDKTATVALNATGAASPIDISTGSAAIPLTVGPNTITITVTPQSGAADKKTYTVTIKRKASSNVNLSALTVNGSNVNMSPAFTPAVCGYTYMPSEGATSVNVSATAADTNATLTINGTAASSGTPSTVDTRSTSTINVIVTAQDGTSKTYTINLLKSGYITFQYPDFSVNTKYLQINNNASYITDSANTHINTDTTVKTNTLRLVPAQYWQAGSAFYNQRISLANKRSFSTEFAFRFTNPGPAGTAADGMVFTIQTVSDKAGSSGGGLGFGGLTPAVGIEYDTWSNYDIGDPSGPHIGLDINGSVRSQATALTGFDIRDGRVYHSWIDYDGTSQVLKVYLSDSDEKPSSPTLTQTGLSLSSILNMDEVYVGFTASTGGCYNNHDILSWYFNNDINPIDTKHVTYKTAPTKVQMTAAANSDNSEIDVAATVYNDDGTEAVNVPVTFTATNGVLKNSVLYTDSNGTVNTVLPSTGITGATTIKAVTLGGAYDQKTFTMPISDIAVVKADKDSIKIMYAPGDDQNNVRLNVSLPSAGAAGSTITWASASADIAPSTTISGKYYTGTVTRPAYLAGDENVTITATITKGSATDTQTFVLLLKKADYIAPKITIDKTEITESAKNDGSIDSTSSLSMNLDALGGYKFNSGISASDIKINNLPIGLSYTVSYINENQIKIGFTGNAAKSDAADSINNASVTLSINAIAGIPADITSDLFKITFSDPTNITVNKAVVNELGDTSKVPTDYSTGKINDTIDVVLANGTFTGIDVSDATKKASDSGITINNLPDGLVPVVKSVSDDAKKITIGFEGAALNNDNANDVDNASITISKDKITGAATALTTNTFKINFDDPEPVLKLSNPIMYEDTSDSSVASDPSDPYGNVGKIKGSETLTLDYGTFTDDISDSDVSVAGLPAGLNIKIAKVKDHPEQLTLTFGGNAIYNRVADDVSGLRVKVNFNKINPTNPEIKLIGDINSSSFGINFIDPYPSIKVSKTEVSEASANDGSIDNSVPQKVYVDYGTFVTDLDTLKSSVKVNNLPEGLTADISLAYDASGKVVDNKAIQIAFNGNAVNNKAINSAKLSVTIDPAAIVGAVAPVTTESFDMNFIDPSDADYVKADADLLASAGIQYATGDTADSVTQDVYFVGNGENGTTITWTTNQLSVMDGNGKVTRPDYCDASGNINTDHADVVVTATVQKGSASKQVTFNVKVITKPMTNTDAVNLDWKDAQIIYGYKDIPKDLPDTTPRVQDAADSITKNLTLTEMGGNGSDIIWQSANADTTDNTVIISNSGVVGRPDYYDGDKKVNITATISKGTGTNSASRTKEFSNLTVKAAEITDADKKAAQDDIDSLVVTKGTDSESSITQDLSLTSGKNNYKVKWELVDPSDSNTLDVTSGKITRPDFYDGDKTVKLKATLTKGLAPDNTYTVERTYTLTVKAAEITDADKAAAEADAENAIVKYTVSTDSAASVTGDVYLTTGVISGGKTDKVLWTSDDPTITVKTDGTNSKVTRPDFYDGDKTVTLKMALTKGLAPNNTYTVEKTYTLTVKAQVLTDADKASAETDAENAIVKYTVSGDSAASVTGDVYLTTGITSGDKTDKVVWSSSDTAITVKTDGNNSTVTRPNYYDGDKTLTLTSTLTKGLEPNNTYVIEKTYTLTVKAQALTDADKKAVQDAADSVGVGYKGTDSAASVMQDVYLTAGTANGVTVVWTSSNSIINVAGTNGRVIRPVYNVGDKTVTLTATLTKGLAPNNTYSLTKTFTLTVKKLAQTDDEALYLDKALLDIIYAAGDSAESVTKDVYLTSGGIYGSTIKWTSSDTGIIGVDGKVTQPSYENGDKTVILTATIAKNGTTDTKTFTLTVKKLSKGSSDSVASDKAALEIIYAIGDTAESVTKDVYLTSGGINGTSITWSSSDATIVGTDGKVARPAYMTGDKTVTLTATITKGGVNDTKTFVLTIKKLLETDEESVQSDMEKLDIGYAPMDSADSVTQNVTLPSAQTDGSTITWTSSDIAVSVDKTTGIVERPDKTSADKTVIMTATITKGKSLRTKTFKLTVKKQAASDTDYIQLDKDALSITYADGDSAASVTQNIKKLPSSGANGSSVIWKSNNQDLISNNGTVNRPSYNQGDQKVTLTAIIQKGTVTDIKTFVLNVVKQPASLYEALKTVEIGYSDGDNANSVTKDVYLTLNGTNGTSINWTSSDDSIINVVDDNGVVARPTYTAGSKIVTITATITKDGSSLAKKFVLTVVKNSITSKEAVDLAGNQLAIQYAVGDSEASVKNDVYLPLTGMEGTTVTWSSDTTGIIANNGAVTRPAYASVGQGTNGATVVLTATITKGSGAEGYTATKKFTLTVIKQPYTVPVITAERTVLEEVYSNDGTNLQQVIDIISGGTFADNIASYVNVNNLPAGLVASVTKNSPTQIAVQLTPIAQHHACDSVADTFITVKPEGINIGSSKTALNNVVSQKFAVKFKDPSEVRTSTTDINDDSGHVGHIMQPLVINITNSKFTNDVTSGVIVNNLPSGISIGSITRNDDGSQITINFTGRSLKFAGAPETVSSVTYDVYNGDVLNASVTIPKNLILGALEDQVTNNFKINFEFREPILTLNTHNFYESANNDGSIDSLNNTETVNLSYGTFTFTPGSAISSTDVKLSNVPSGLNYTVTCVNHTQLSIKFSGNASANALINTMKNISVEVLKSKILTTNGETLDALYRAHYYGAAVSGKTVNPFSASRKYVVASNEPFEKLVGETTLLADATPSDSGYLDSDPFNLNFRNLPPAITTVESSISEASDNKGEISGTLNVKIYNGNFRSADNVVISNLPSGLTANATLTADNTVIAITFSGAVTNNDLKNSVTNAVVTVPAADIEGGTNDLSTGTFSLLFNTPSDSDILKKYIDSLDTTGIGYAPEDSKDHVTSNVRLNKITSDGTLVTWTSNAPLVIGNDGTVNCPSFIEGDTPVTLTATVTKGTTSLTKDFILTVIKKQPTDKESTDADAKNLAIGYVQGDSESSITQNVTLPISGPNGTVITWSANPDTIIDSNGNVTRTGFDGLSETVTVTAKVSKGSATTTKTFTVTVISQSQGDANSVAADKGTVEPKYAAGDNAGSVTQNITLPLIGNGGSTVIWTSSNTGVIGNDGKVNRPSNTDGSKTVTLTATITKGAVTDTNTFKLYVVKANTTDAEAVNFEKSNLTIGFTAPDTASNITQKLTLPTQGTDGTTITWSSNVPGVIGNDGTVTRPQYGSGDQNVVLTATIKRGSTEITVTFPVTVVKAPYVVPNNPNNPIVVPTPATTDKDSVGNDKNSLQIKFGDGSDALSVIGDLILPVKGDNDSIITWTSSNPDVISNTGKVTRPGQDTTVTLTATITKGNETATKTFTLTVLKKPALADVYVNGVKVADSANAVTFTDSNNNVIIRDILDPEKVMKNVNLAGQNALITIPVPGEANIVYGQLNLQLVKDLQAKNATVEIKTSNSSYFIPAQQINIDDISNKLGKTVALKDITVSVKISDSTAAEKAAVQKAASEDNAELIGPQKDFDVMCTANNQTVDVTNFTKYVKRLIEIPADLAKKITTGVVLNADGKVSHVPTSVTVDGSKYYAQISSLTNSTYSVVWHPLQFADVSKHWSKDAVNDMASRMIINGYPDGTFKPDKSVTRGEFAKILVTALGLQPNTKDEAGFTDLKNDNPFYGYINQAKKYNLINGYADGSFKVNATISRQEVMAMISRAMNLTDLKSKFSDKEAATSLEKFTDGNKISPWARSYAAACINDGVIIGSNNQLKGSTNLSRAEAVTIVKRLLTNSGLINK